MTAFVGVFMVVVSAVLFLAALCDVVGNRRGRDS